MTRRLLGLIITVGMIISLVSTLPMQAAVTIKIGDYVQMGKYYDESILWRCVDIDENGPLLLSDKILTYKPFDAAGNHTYLDGTAQVVGTHDFRTINGSNLWETSNMRSWLNSTATAGNVTWLDGCPPTADKVPDGLNAYANEKGFLGNFTKSEQDAVKYVAQKSLLSIIDVAKLREGGTAIHMFEYSIAKVEQNFDDAYYQNVTDKMFLLDVKQLNKVYQNSATLGTDYYIGKPTKKAVDNFENKNRKSHESNLWYYWLRSPTGNSTDNVRGVGSDGRALSGVLGATAFYNHLGVRPAFYLNLSSAIFKSGSGSENDPYVADTMPIKVLLDVKELDFDVPPQMINDRTMVPLRRIFEALGAEVIWDENTNTITGKKGATTVVLTVDSTSATVNGEPKTLDVPATIIDGRTLVPARFISESLGCKVDWDDATRTVVIKTE